jgi:hypothetical protein
MNLLTRRRSATFSTSKEVPHVRKTKPQVWGFTKSMMSAGNKEIRYRTLNFDPVSQVLALEYARILARGSHGEHDCFCGNTERAVWKILQGGCCSFLLLKSA